MADCNGSSGKWLFVAVLVSDRSHSIPYRHDCFQHLQTLESLNEDSICRSLELTNMILESTSKDLNAIQEQLRDTEKAIQKTKEEVCFFHRCYIVISSFLSVKVWVTFVGFHLEIWMFWVIPFSFTQTVH